MRELVQGVHLLRGWPPNAINDPPANRASARRLAQLRPTLACFGHGPPLRDPGKLADFVASLPD